MNTSVEFESVFQLSLSNGLKRLSSENTDWKTVQAKDAVAMPEHEEDKPLSSSEARERDLSCSEPSSSEPASGLPQIGDEIVTTLSGPREQHVTIRLDSAEDCLLAEKLIAGGHWRLAQRNVAKRRTGPEQNES